MNNPLISVLVPVYNCEKYLEDCLGSIINQKYKNLEIILVNDGSTDSSGAICDKYAKKDSRIKVSHQKNKGIADTRNVCLSLASGNYIGFVDGDDFISPDMYDKMMAVAVETDADMVVCNFANTTPEGKVKSAELSIPFSEGEIWKNDYIDKVSGEVVGLLSIAWNKLYKKHLFGNLSYPSGKIHEDDATIHRICHRCNKIYYLPDILYFYRHNNDGIMHKKYSACRLDSTDAVLDRISFLEENGYSEEMIHNCKIFLISDFVNSIRNLDKKSKENRKAIKEKFSLVKPYCKILLKSDKTDNDTKKVIRCLLLNPFLFFYI